MIPELIVKLRSGFSQEVNALSRHHHSVAAPTAVPSALNLHKILVANGLSARPLRQHQADPPLTAATETASGIGGRLLDSYWSISAARDAQEALRAEIALLPETEAAFIVPAPEVMRLTTITAPAAQGRTPNFRGDQGYLDAAPGGINAEFAWALAGGRGQGTNIIDIEGDWLLDHEKLKGRVSKNLSLFADPMANWQGQHDLFVQHGTSVLGEIVAAGDGVGVTGIASEASVGVVSHMHREQSGKPSGPATAIANATDLLNPGDILLLEMHMPGPRFGFASRNDQLGFIAVEWWEHIFAAIKDATDRGIIVVEAAGNGRENLDDILYEKGANFSSTWRNPFGRERDASRNSGAIIVGAGAPPSGHFGPDRSRLDFSNFGSTVDAQGWGREVVTSGGGDLHGGRPQVWYTAQFAGTSSASPIVVGAIACVQGVLRARGLPLLGPGTARNLLRSTGSPQPASESTTRRIGNRPNLTAMIKEVAEGEAIA